MQISNNLKKYVIAFKIWKNSWRNLLVLPAIPFQEVNEKGKVKRKAKEKQYLIKLASYVISILVNSSHV